MAARSMMIQARWNQVGMQNQGFMYAIMPGLRELYSDDESLMKSVACHEEPFNTHPYLAGVIVGASLNMEADGVPKNRIATMTRSAMGILGSLGDPFFWAAVAPLASALAALSAIMLNPWFGLLVFFAVYGYYEIPVRSGGVFLGYRMGEKAVALVARRLSARRAGPIRALAAFAAGILLPVASARYSASADTGIAVTVVTGLLALVGAEIVRRQWITGPALLIFSITGAVGAFMWMA